MPSHNPPSHRTFHRTAFSRSGPAVLRRFTQALAVGLGSLALVAAASAADLSVKISNIQDGTGMVMVALFVPGNDFPKTFSQGKQVAAAARTADGDLRVVFVDLPPGQYAVSAYHDRNSNGKLDANLLGIPSEPYGFSNDAKGSFGPPKFSDAAIDVGAQAASALVQLQ